MHTHKQSLNKMEKHAQLFRKYIGIYLSIYFPLSLSVSLCVQCGCKGRGTGTDTHTSYIVRIPSGCMLFAYIYIYDNLKERYSIEIMSLIRLYIDDVCEPYICMAEPLSFLLFASIFVMCHALYILLLLLLRLLPCVCMCVWLYALP